MDFHRWFAVAAVIVAVVRYGTYLWSIYRGETRPHIFTWFNWGLTGAIGAYALLALHGGPAVWVKVFVATNCFVIAGVSLFVGEKKITRSDVVAFVIALLAVPAWQLCDNPVMALVLIMLIDCLAYYPTIRKSYNDPWGEPPRAYFWAGLRDFFILLAVSAPAPATLFYPAFLTVIAWGFGIYLVWRRRVLASKV